MTLLAGTVTVDDDGNGAGDGLALALYEARVKAADDAEVLPSPDRMPKTYLDAIAQDPPMMEEDKAREMLADARLADLRVYAMEATATATAVVTYFTTNATITQSGAQAYAEQGSTVGEFEVAGALVATQVKAPGLGLSLPVSGGTYELK